MKEDITLAAVLTGFALLAGASAWSIYQMFLGFR